MTDQPYTQADLIAEAARQHSELTEGPDYMGVGEQMLTTPIPSAASGATWCRLPSDDFETAQRAIHDLIGEAADLSEWAVEMGAEGLLPARHVMHIRWRGHTTRLFFGFPPDMPEDDRRALISMLRGAVEDV